MRTMRPVRVPLASPLSPVPMSIGPSGVRMVAATAQSARAHARQLGKRRAAQPLPRGQQRDGFQQVGLARAVGTGEHDGFGADARDRGSRSCGNW